MLHNPDQSIHLSGQCITNKLSHQQYQQIPTNNKQQIQKNILMLRNKYQPITNTNKYQPITNNIYQCCETRLVPSTSVVGASPTNFLKTK